MPRDLAKGHAALRRGRSSLAGAEYFLTLCTAGRNQGLTAPKTISAIMVETLSMERDSTWLVRCMVIMPDHVHLLIVLGDGLPLGKAVARLKAKTAADLCRQHPELTWERGFFDHRMRADEDHLSVFLYVFLNPYRNGLCQRDQVWPGYRCDAEDWSWFQHRLECARPMPEWLA